MDNLILNLPPEFLAMTPARCGSSSYVLQNESLTAWLHERFGPAGLCLKVFPSLSSPEDDWEFVPLKETATVQNLFAAEGWAPRVHALVKLADGPMAEVVDYADRIDGLPPDAETLRPFWALIDRYGIGTRSRVCEDGGLKWDFLLDTARSNWSRRRLLDWGGKYRLALFPEWNEPQPERAGRGAC